MDNPLTKTTRALSSRANAIKDEALHEFYVAEQLEKAVRAVRRRGGTKWVDVKTLTLKEHRYYLVRRVVSVTLTQPDLKPIGVPVIVQWTATGWQEVFGNIPDGDGLGYNSTLQVWV